MPWCSQFNKHRLDVGRSLFDAVLVRDVLTRAATFCEGAQTSSGGWHYTADAGDAAESAVTMIVLQGVREARNAGIPVARAVLTKATPI
jgi:hypothetical protein